MHGLPLALCLLLATSLLGAAPAPAPQVKGQRPSVKQPVAAKTQPMVLEAKQNARVLRQSLKHAPGNREAAVLLERRLSSEQEQALDRVARIWKAELERAYKQRKSVKSDARLRQRLQPHISAVGTRDVAALSTAALERTAQMIEDDVDNAANKVAQNNEAAAVLREEIAMLRDEVLDWPDDGSTREITYRELIAPDLVTVEKTEVMTKEQAKALIAKMESQLATLADTSQQDMMKLQDAMNKQAQLMQMMSNLMKMFHDTASAIVRNLK